MKFIFTLRSGNQQINNFNNDIPLNTKRVDITANHYNLVSEILRTQKQNIFVKGKLYLAQIFLD